MRLSLSHLSKFDTMTTQIPPSYVAADAAPPPYSREEDIKIQVAAAKEFATNPKVAAALELDIDNFTQTLKDVDDDFRTASVKLGDIDSKNLTSTKYQAPWDKFYAVSRACHPNSLMLLADIRYDCLG